MINAKKIWLGLALMLLVGTSELFATTTMKITCTVGETCTTESKLTGGTWTPNNFPTFTVSATGSKNISGEVYAVYQVPNTTGPLSFTVNGSGPVLTTTWSGTNISRLGALGFSSNQTKGTSDPNMASQQSQTLAVENKGGLPNSTGYTIYVFDLGPMTNGVGPGVLTTGAYVGLPSGGLPIGTVIYTYLTASACLPDNSDCKVINSSPNSQALAIGPGGVTPEPASMALFGSGLVALGGMMRRRKKA